MKSIRLIFLVFFGLNIQAAEFGDLFKEKKFICTIVSITLTGDDLDASFEWTNKGSNQGSHGGKEHTFEKGEDRFVAIGNDRWLGLAWWRGKRKIGESVTLTTERSAESRVLILLHPDNDEERAYIDCTRQEPK